MMMYAVLSNPNHPEYGVATIPFPIPHDQYAHCMELLEALEIGDAVKTDCKVEKIDSFYTVLKRAEMLTVNVEELNYLAKRLESFDTGEAAQFQAMAHKLELFELKDFINLTFCCQQATVITDFSDLAAVGRDHYMNLHGGSASVDELNALDGKGTARQLIDSGSGTITPYGVVYDNGMKLEQAYTVTTEKSGQATTLSTNSRPQFDFVNNYRKSAATLTVEKIVNGADTSGSFPFVVSCVITDPNTGEKTTVHKEFTLTNHGVQNVANLPIGAEVTLTETKYDGYTAAVYRGGKQVADSGTYTFTITENTELTVYNTLGVPLPETGGATPYLFIYGGLFLMLSAVVTGYILRRRYGKEGLG